MLWTLISTIQKTFKWIFKYYFLLKSCLKYSKYSKIWKYYVIPNTKSLSPHLKCLSPHVAIGDKVEQCWNRGYIVVTWYAYTSLAELLKQNDLILALVHGPSRAEQPRLERLQTVRRILPPEQPPENGSGQDHQITRAARALQIWRTLPGTYVSRKSRIFPGFSSILRRPLHLHCPPEGHPGV